MKNERQGDYQLPKQVVDQVTIALRNTPIFGTIS